MDEIGLMQGSTILQWDVLIVNDDYQYLRKDNTEWINILHNVDVFYNWTK
jgi:hypothetical protein